MDAETAALVRAALVELVDDLAEWSWDTVAERPRMGAAAQALADAAGVDLDRIVTERCKDF